MYTFKKTASVAAGVAALVMAGAGVASAGAEAQGAAVGSPGVLSGNNLQIPIHVPINVCGNSINIIGVLNPTIGNVCANVDGGHEKEHGGHEAPHHGEHHEAPHHGQHG
ncbi:chaplin [Embleya hyalina]|uniref:Membrane protein n=1 Tax=Embleya hyalina TaxID=516124 RepID=A0A401YPQ8_9ACTN|nr:chaplin [Embleya hyalina]GCD96583.1 membrane protein [Embleya hyalina]